MPLRRDKVEKKMSWLCSFLERKETPVCWKSECFHLI